MVVLLMFLLSGGLGELDFDTRLIHKLSQILNVTPPTKILVERLDQKELLGDLRGTILKNCMGGRPDLFQYCAEVARQYTETAFVHGIWIEEKDPTFLHIKLYKRSGIDALIHEYLHWYLNYKTRPHGVINTHEVLLPLVTTLLASNELQVWLEKEEKP